MNFNDAGLALLKSFEGCKLDAYQDSGGVWTIGYGCTHGVKPGLSISPQEADARLLEDLKDTAAQVRRVLKDCALNENQFSAVVCFTYNVGIGNLQQSTLLNCIRLGHFDDAALEFLKWCKINGVPSPGVLRRRVAEQSLFKAPTTS